MPVYKSKTRDSWYCSFYYTDWTGKRKRKKKEGFSTKKEARQYEAAFLLQREGRCDMTFEALSALYLSDCRERCKPTSYYEKKYLIETKILPYFKTIRANEIKVCAVRAWQNELLSYRSSVGKPYSDTYLRSIYVQLSAVFNYGMRYYGLPSNPAALCGSMGRKKSPVMAFWTVDEFQRFLSCFAPDSLDRVLFEILFWTGLRSGELLALSAESFDLEKGLMHITRNYCRLHGEDLMLTPKTSKSVRTVTLPGFLRDEIGKYIADQSLYYGGFPDGERLFPISKYYLARQLKNGCIRSGVREIRIHDLRHSHASLLIELGYSPLLIAERLGHEKIETTLQTYSHLYPNKQSDLALKLEDIHNRTF